MEIIAEGPESFANDSYTLLLERTLVDMGITTSIEKVQVDHPIRPSRSSSYPSAPGKAGGSRMVSEISHHRGEGGRDLHHHHR